MKKFMLLLVLSGTALVYSCKKEMEVSNKGVLTLDLPANPYRYFGDMEELNTKATLGRVLFYDNVLSVNNSVACASCHTQANGFADNAAFSRGFENRLTTRNSMTIANLTGGGFLLEPDKIGGFEQPLFWDGRETNLQSLIMRPVTNHVEMGIDDPEVLPAKLNALPYYKALFADAYGSEEITTAKISEAMSLFLQSITATNTRFDQFSMGMNSLTPLEMQGLNLFNTKYDCAGCHNATVAGYSMGVSFMNIGLDASSTDKGLAGVTNSAADMGKFKIPNLRNVAFSAPYMHDGRFATLEDVLEHYSHGIQPAANLDERLLTAQGQPMKMKIADQEKKAIVAFLHTLSDYDMLTAPKYSSPFKVN